MNAFENRLSDYFGGWERFGIKEDDGQITTVYPDQMPTVSLGLDPEDEIFFAPAQEVDRHYVMYDNLTDKDLQQQKDRSGNWKPGRLVISTSLGRYQVWVSYKEKLSRVQKAQLLGTPIENNTKQWASMPKEGLVVHLDGVGNEKVTAVKHNMEPVLNKLGRFFESYELGVYMEKGNGQEGAVWAVEPKPETIGYLKAMNANGKHIFIRPTFEKEDHFMLHDDLDRKGLDQYHKDPNGHWKPGRLIVQSSPGNYQVWIKSDRPLGVEGKKHWLDQMKSDPGASPKHRWGRCPGFRNRKAKYQTKEGYPLARMEWIDWKNRAKVPAIEIEKKQRHTGGVAPRREKFSGDLPTRDMYFKGMASAGKAKDSEQDFAYSLALLRRGVPKDVIKERIINERADWTNHKGEKRMADYLNRTLDRAEGIISNQAYRIVVKNVEQNIEQSTVVKNLKENEAKAIVEDRARSMAVQIGFEKASDIRIDVEPFKECSNNKKKALSLGLCKM